MSLSLNYKNLYDEKEKSSKIQPKNKQARTENEPDFLVDEVREIVKCFKSNKDTIK